MLTKSILNFQRFWMMGAVLSISFPAIASATAPEPAVGNPSIIEQLNIVKSTLAELGGKMDALAAQLQSVDDELNGKLDAANGKLDTTLAILDVHGTYLGILLDDAESVEKDITISNTLCFSVSAFQSFALGASVEAGAGWPNVAHLQLAAKIDVTSVGVDMNLSEQICIDIPLYKIASAPLADFDNTEDFDQLIADIVAPSQAIVPVVATLYTAIMPSKDQAIAATANVIEAATGFDILTGVTGTPHPEDFLRPDIMFAPVLLEPYQAFIDYIPAGVAALATDPCGALANSPLQINVNSVPVCAIGAGAAHIAFNLIDPLHLLHPNSGEFPDL